MSASPQFVRAVLSRLTDDEREALVTEALSHEIGLHLFEHADEGCACEEHLAQYREE